MMTVSILFIIVRGIEFGDEKTQKWLTSIIAGFCSSILLSQPLKVAATAMKLISSSVCVRVSIRLDCDLGHRCHFFLQQCQR
jgi:hypothetical protein